MKNMSLFATVLFSTSVFAGVPRMPPAMESIYGYAIKCMSDDGKVKVSARQSDDDFKFQSLGLGKRAESVFMDSAQKHNPMALSLKFDSVESETVDLSFTLQKIDDATGNGYVHASGQIVNLSCEYRVGRDEDEFDNQNLAQWADEILVKTERWGGDHIHLTVNGDVASFQFDCAQAEASDWTVKRGKIRANGTYYPQSGVPYPPGHGPKPVSAVFEATVTAKAMTLKITPQGYAATTYRLTKDKEGKITRCM